MKYLLISVIERDIYTEIFTSLDEAKTALVSAFKKYLNDQDEDMCSLSKDHTVARIIDGFNHDDYDFKIVEIK